MRGLNIQEVYQCLEYIRKAPGKVYEYELCETLNRPELMRENIAEKINGLLGMIVVDCAEKESSGVEKEFSGEENGLNVIYTNPEYRMVVDILLSEQAGDSFDRTVYVDCTKEEIKGNKAEVRLFYNEVEKRLDALIKKHENTDYLLKAKKILGNWPRIMELDMVDWKTILNHHETGIPDLSGKYIYNVDCSGQTSSVIIKNLKAEQAFFSGADKIVFDEVVFQGGVSFKGSIFKAKTLSFKNAKFYPGTTAGGKDGSLEMNEISFRDTRMLVSGLEFDEIVVDGENVKFSFEDAVIDAEQVSFSKMRLNGVNLFCYQSIMENAHVKFIEPKFVNSQLNFEDSRVKAVTVLNVMGLPKTEFAFKTCQKIFIENCDILDNVTLKGMDVLSLRACRNYGKILTDWEKKKKDSKGNKNFPILLAVMHNKDKDNIKAEQFILLKENFANLGQYDYEDEAFIQYMNYRCKKSPMRGIYGILRLVGKYGISPGRVLLTMLTAVLIFFGSYLLCAHFDPGAFSHIAAENDCLGRISKLFYLSVSNLVSYDCGIEAVSFTASFLSMVESIIGWFLLGYLSVAILRKTLR